MANNKDFVENGNIAAEASAVLVQPPLAVDAVDSNLDPTRKIKVNEKNQPSSSISHLRSHFVGMGFSPRLVDKVLQKNGADDANIILECLLSYSLKPDSFSKRRSYLLKIMNFSEQEVDLAFNQLGQTASLEQLVDCIITNPKSGATNEDMRAELLDENMQVVGYAQPRPNQKTVQFRPVQSGWAAVLVLDVLDRACPLPAPIPGELHTLGDALNSFVQWPSQHIRYTNTPLTPRKVQRRSAISPPATQPQKVPDQNRSPQEKAEDQFGAIDKTLHLLEMGFTEKEVSSAIKNFGLEVSVLELADSIFASRIANNIKEKEVKIDSGFLGDKKTKRSSYHVSSLDAPYYEDEEIVRVKKAKTNSIDEKGASSSRSGNQALLSPWVRVYSANSLGQRFVKVEPDMMTPGRRANIHGALAKPPYFFYGNVIEISRDTWGKLSQFLFSVEPEFLNSQHFSALIREEGFIHNLPTEGMHVAIPKSPTTIGDVLSFTRPWWPSWDARNQINAIHKEVEGIEQTCERLRKMMRDSGGVLSKEQQIDISRQCRAANLIWVGKDRLSPLEPRQVERILGYPPNHTQLSGLNPVERLTAMKYAFQTDTLAYFLSVLKDIYPDGLRVLSIYSGVGGAEVALHRLGIPLKCVVSVESSNVNRRILKRWWAETQQAGQLRQLDNIWRLRQRTLEDLVKEFGGFDLIIGGNPGDYNGVGTINGLMGIDSNLFFEFVRVVRGVRSIVGSKG